MHPGSADDTTRAFALEIRVVACDECGAPLVVGQAGGLSRCTHCGSEPRALSSATRAVTRASPMPEHVRMASLRAQDAWPPSPPEELGELFAGLELLPWKIGPALAAWRLTRAEAGASRDVRAQRRLHRLGLALASHFGAEGDLLRERSLLEATLEGLDQPPLQQAVCAALSWSASRAGDPRAAAAWLALCDPAPASLHADTAYRHALATMELHAGNFEGVLRAVGTSHADFPLDDELEPRCVAMRAHALESLGRAAQALAVLDHYFAHVTSVQRHRCIAACEAMRLCPTSLPAAQRRLLALLRRAATESGGAGLGCFGLSLALSLVALVSFAVPAYHGHGLIAHSVGAIVGFLPLLVLGLTSGDLIKRRRTKRLLREGRSSLGRVVHAWHTGVTTFGRPEVMYRVLVLPTGGVPFLAHSVFHTTPTQRARYVPGALVVVRHDSESRGNVALELDP